MRILTVENIYQRLVKNNFNRHWKKVLIDKKFESKFFCIKRLSVIQVCEINYVL